MEKGSGHGVELVCDIGDDDMIMTGDSVEYFFRFLTLCYAYVSYRRCL